MPRPLRVAVMLDLQWPYKRHAGVLTGVLQYSQKQNWEIVVDEFVDDTLTHGSADTPPYDGIIARATKKLALRANKLHIPLVNVWLSSPAWKIIPGVFSDYAAIGRMRAEHLLARGFRNFAALTCLEDRALDLEIASFSKAIEQAGFHCHVQKIPNNPSTSVSLWRKTQQAITEWMEGWKLPIGVFVGAESDGRIVSQMCRNRGWPVPEQVAIITGHNEETICAHLRPTLTSIEVGFEQIGFTAARVLDQMMGGKAQPNEPILVPPQGLVVRESTDFFAVDDPLIAKSLQYISTKCNQDITPDDVANSVTMGTRTLQRRFIKYLNRPIATEIRRVRIERAKRELAYTRKPLKEVARDVGFGTAMRMYEIFRREVGLTPSQFRKERQANK